MVLKGALFSMEKNFEPQCMFCGASVGEISERTNKQVEVVYYCPKCRINYCSECSYEKEIDGKQFCLRCDSLLTKVSEK